jgi:DNA-binding SARP family transcriptional activator
VAWSGQHQTEQLLAGEMTYDKPTREFVTRSMKDNPIVQTLIQRVEVMRAVARKYQKTSAPAAEEVGLKLGAFGSGEIELRGKRIVELEPLPRQILFYLADHVPAERDRLMEAIWPDTPATRQTASLYTALHALRKALAKDIVMIEGALYRINPEYTVQFDVGDFEQAASMAEALPAGDPRRLFLLTEAIHTCNGPFLPEFSSNWVEVRRHGLEERFLKLLIAHADEAVARGQPDKAVESFRQALEIEPLRDDLNMNYLELLYQLERRAEAIGHYHRYVRRLADELGLDPSPALRDLYIKLIG